MQPIDLRQFGRHVDQPAGPWSASIPCCNRARIFPHGEQRLAAAVRRPEQVAQLSALGLRCLVDDGVEATFAFGPEDFQLVALVLRPARLRKVNSP